MIKTAINRFAVLIVSYLLVGLVEFLDWPFYHYYTSLIATGLIVTILCTPLFTRKADYLLIGYAVLQVLTMMLYLCMLTDEHYYVADWLLYYAENSLTFLLYTYELIILLGIGGAFGLAFCHWTINGIMRNTYTDKYH